MGKVLDRLRERGWFALHDVQLGRGNIDHVLVGPAGVFTIETKSHCGRLRASAIEVRMLKQAYALAKLIERITGLRADPLLVFSNAYLIPAVTRRDGVLILPARMLAGHLQRRARPITRSGSTTSTSDLPPCYWISKRRRHLRVRTILFHRDPRSSRTT